MKKIRALAVFPGTGGEVFAHLNKPHVVDKINIPNSVPCYLLSLQDLIRDDRPFVVDVNHDVLTELHDLGVQPVLIYPEQGLEEEYVRRATDVRPEIMRENYAAVIESLIGYEHASHLVLGPGMAVADVIRFNTTTNQLELID